MTEEIEQRKKRGRHPAFGWMKGMIRIPPGIDLTEPAYPELADIAEESCAEFAKMLSEAKVERKS